jgi:hypothetical protein
VPVRVVSWGIVADRVPVRGAVAPSRLEGSRRLDRYAELGCAAAALAIEGAGGIRPRRGDDEWGIVLGSSLGCWASNAEYLTDLERGRPASLSPALFVRTVANSVAGEIAIAHGIGGATQTIVSGWTAGAEALAEACALLAEGRARYVLAGGIEAPDDTLREQHRSRRRTLSWLPDTLEEAAALCVLTVAEGTVAGPRIVAYGRGQDPHGEWSLSDALRRLEAPEIGSVVVGDPVPSELLDRWRREVGEKVLVQPALGSLVFGAAGAPLALSSFAGQFEGAALLLARGFEGTTIAIVILDPSATMRPAT